MKEEDIKEKVLLLLNQKKPEAQDALLLVVEYVKQVKNINITHEQLMLCERIFTFNNMVESALEFFKKKLAISSLYTSSGEFIKAF